MGLDVVYNDEDSAWERCGLPALPAERRSLATQIAR